MKRGQTEQQQPQGPNPGLFYRHFALRVEDVNEKSRSLELSFSSEYPVPRWFGKEILLHGPDNADLSRINSMGSVLFNHNPDRIVGAVEKAWLADRTGKANITFDDDPDGEHALGKVKKKSLRGVSVGYQVEKYRKVEEDEEFEGIRGPAYVATRWSPVEITLTPVPADPTVGVGRELTRSLDGITIEQSKKHETQIKKEETAMDEKQIRELIATGIADGVKAAVPAIVQQVRAALVEDAKPKQVIPADRALELMARAKGISAEEQATVADMIFKGRSETDVVNHMLDTRMGKADATDTGGIDATKGKGNGTEKREMGEDDIAAAFTTSPVFVK